MFLGLYHFIFKYESANFSSYNIKIDKRNVRILMKMLLGIYRTTIEITHIREKQ
jgi:hypothetical protein